MAIARPGTALAALVDPYFPGDGKMKLCLATSPLRIAAALAVSVLASSADAALMALSVDGVVTFGFNQGLDANARPYFGGADPKAWVGLPIHAEWRVRSQSAPTDLCTDPGITSSDRYLGCYSHYFGSEALGGTSANSSGRPFIDLTGIVIGESLRLDIPRLEPLPLFREDERVTVAAFPAVAQDYDLYDAVETRDTAEHLPTPGPYPWSGSLRNTYLFFLAPAFLESDELFQSFDVTSFFQATGAIRFTDFSSVCARNATGDAICNFSRLDEGAIVFAPTHVTAWLVAAPDTAGCLMAGFLSLLAFSRRPTRSPVRHRHSFRSVMNRAFRRHSSTASAARAACIRTPRARIRRASAWWRSTCAAWKTSISRRFR